MTSLFVQKDGSESQAIPEGMVMLISDCLEAPATFLVVQHLAQALKAKRKCILVGFGLGFEHYAAVLRKQSIQLQNERDKGKFEYIDALQEMHNERYGGFAQNIFEHVKSILTPDSLVVIDDVGAFEETEEGEEEDDSGEMHPPLVVVLQQIRKLLAASRRLECSTIAVLHDDAFLSGRKQIDRTSEQHALLRNLIQLSDVWIQTRSLRAQLTGELYIHRGPSLLGQEALDTHTLERPLQYKLEETGPKFFAKGTDKGFL